MALSPERVAQRWLQASQQDSLHGRVKAFMLELGEELRKGWRGSQSGLLRRKTVLCSEPWVIGVRVSQGVEHYDRNIAVHLDRDDPVFAIYDTTVAHQPKQVTTGSFSLEMHSPAQAADAIMSLWESASLSLF